MGDWKITVENHTGDSGVTGRDVSVMLFQCVPDPLIVESYSSAWKTGDIQYPGTLGPIHLPAKVQFYVLDKTNGIPRASGPFSVEFGQQVEVSQDNLTDAPSAKITGTAQPNGEIKVTNNSGNPQPLEMALFKNGRKIVSFKDVTPGDAVYLDVKPVIYIADIDAKHIVEGDDFEAVVQAKRSTSFQLYPDQLEVRIGITQGPNKELKFEKL